MARILLVDDEEDVLTTLRVLLKSEGHEIVPVREGLEALELLRSTEVFDLLMSDIRMAPIDGVELLREARVERPNMGIIVVSAYLDDALMGELKELGCYSFVKKPFMIEEVLDSVRDELIRTGVGLGSH